MPVTPLPLAGTYPRAMDATDPILLIAAGSLVAIVLTPLASRLIASATAELTNEFSDETADLSRVRPRNRR